MMGLICQVLCEEYITFAVLLVNVRLVVLWDVTPCGLEGLVSCINSTDICESAACLLSVVMSSVQEVWE